jgi:hypothetical protein
MTQRSGARRVTVALADATGRSDDELRLALTVAAIVGGLFAALRVLKWLGDLGGNVVHSREGR